MHTNICKAFLNPILILIVHAVWSTVVSLESLFINSPVFSLSKNAISWFVIAQNKRARRRATTLSPASVKNSPLKKVKNADSITTTAITVTVSFNSDFEPSKLTSSISWPKRAGIAREKAVLKSRAIVPRMSKPFFVEVKQQKPERRGLNLSK
jgi:hypothetical protein